MAGIGPEIYRCRPRTPVALSLLLPLLFSLFALLLLLLLPLFLLFPVLLVHMARREGTWPRGRGTFPVSAVQVAPFAYSTHASQVPLPLRRPTRDVCRICATRSPICTGKIGPLRLRRNANRLKERILAAYNNNVMDCTPQRIGEDFTNPSCQYRTSGASSRHASVCGVRKAGGTEEALGLLELDAIDLRG